MSYIEYLTSQYRLSYTPPIMFEQKRRPGKEQFSPMSFFFLEVGGMNVPELKSELSGGGYM